MNSWFVRLAGSGALLAPAWLAAAEAEPARRFAAPDTATALPSTSMGGIGQVTLALLVVLAVVFVLAFVLKKMRTVAGGSQGIEVLAQASLGARERAVVIRVEGTKLLLGVSQGRVNLLHVLPPSASGSEPPATSATPAGTERPSFAQLLRKSLGR
ncbi:MAG TPA: flagellar biosynthetic protein FliO [Steroidobacteraceae bacterium]|nr:flagellar biosynthetic protein FliO [Steroidobacteraceae bacterium]